MYTNSNLVTDTNLSPNHSGERVEPISRLTIHCFVGQVTAKRGLEVFLPKSRKASCNYVVGFDGSVGLCVEEKNRSWCTSSNYNDQKAITIEAASNNVNPYDFTDACYNKLIELSVDICNRNGKNVLVYIPNKDEALKYKPKDNELLITLHKWYANKACPGPWFISKLPEFVNEVNKRLGNVEIKPNNEVKQSDNETIIWDYLKSKINNSYGVAGLMGNLQAESALRPNNLQNSYETKLGYNDDTYTQAVDNGSYTNFVHDSAGYGLAQWTYWSRKQNLLNFKNNSNKSIGDLTLQLDFLFNELSTSYKGVLNGLVNSKSVKEASDLVLTQFERPKDQSDNVKNKRCQLGQDIYNRHVDLTTQQNNDIIYIVKPGDTLSKIAKQYNTTYQKIAVDNKIANPNVIRVGQKLTIKP